MDKLAFRFYKFLGIKIPGHTLHEKKGLRRQKASAHWSATRKKSASRPVDKPRMNRLSTADFVPAFGLYRISLVRASGGTFKRPVFDALGGPRVACLLGELFCWHHPVLPDPARPPRRMPRPDPPVVCPGFGPDKCSNTRSICFCGPHRARVCT